MKSSFLLLNESQTSFEQQMCKGHEKRDKLLISKVYFNFQIYQWSNEFI